MVVSKDYGSGALLLITLDIIKSRADYIQLQTRFYFTYTLLYEMKALLRKY
jgi:hypothetical protein